MTELVSSYHDTVGHNAYMLLDWTPTQTGEMRADHVQRYKEFGDFLKGCYGGANAGATGGAIVPLCAIQLRGHL